MAENHQEHMLTFALTISYNGQPFNGYAKQPGQLTVQGSLEEALSLIFRQRIETVCSGRTDSGVHARGQVVSFSIPESAWENRSEYKVLRSLNALTHESIAIKKIEKKAPDFSARFSAVSREYRYFISTDPYAPLLMEDFSWHLGKKLNLDAMRKAARYLIGEHDFKSFCLAVSAGRKPTHRYVVSITIEPYEVWGENLVCITIVGNAFLHSMVRTIVGTLVMVGLGKREPEWMKEVLEARSRSAAGENAPAEGLVFWKVNYTGKRYYDPSEKRIKEEKKKALQVEKKKTNQKPHRGLSDVLAEYIPHRGAEAEFVIPRGESRVANDEVFSEIKPGKPACPIPDIKKKENLSTVIPDIEIVDDELFVLDETGKLPLTLSAWDTGKLEPVTVANLKEGILPPSEKSASKQDSIKSELEEINTSKKDAKQAMSNLRELERNDSEVFLKKIYPFQRK